MIIYLEYGKIPVAAFIISLAIILPIMIFSGIYGYKHRQQISQSKSKIFYFYLIIGICIIVIDGTLIVMGERGVSYYVGIGAGFISLFYGIKQMKKN